MRRFVIDRHGAAATGEEPHVCGVEWPDGFVTVRSRTRRDGGLDEPGTFRSIGGLEETAKAKVRWLDGPNANSDPLVGADGRVVDWTTGELPAAVRAHGEGGKLPSEEIGELARRDGYPAQARTDGVIGDDVMIVTIHPRHIVEYLDRRLGRSK